MSSLKQYSILPFYNNLSNQNRNNSLCSSVCDFKLLSTCDDLLPFQFNADIFGTVLTFKITNIDTAAEIDLISCASFLNKYVTTTSGTYIVYNGESIKSCIPSQIDCGSWYIEIADENSVYYSEVFYVQSITEVEPSGFIPVNGVWPFYDNILKTNRYKSNCSAYCDYSLIAPNGSLIPFEIKRPTSISPILSWKLVAIDESCEVELDTSLLNIDADAGGVDYIEYFGDSISDLPCGVFYSVITDGVNIWYSELINLTDSVTTIQGLQTDSGVNIITDSSDQILID